MDIQLYCFCTPVERSGNPAAVVRDFAGAAEAKQAFARQRGLPVSVFISDEASDCPLLEYYYPGVEMPLCVHGTLAAAYVLFDARGDCHSLTCKTKSGQLLQVRKSGDVLDVAVSSQATSSVSIAAADICQILGVQLEDLDRGLPFQLASVGSPKLCIPVNSLKTLMNLRLDIEAIRDWSARHCVNGFYVYTQDTFNPSSDVHARGFNPLGGDWEDAATGVAAAALATLLKRDLIIEQGYVIDKPSELRIRYQDDNSIFVGGRVRLA